MLTLWLKKQNRLEISSPIQQLPVSRRVEPENRVVELLVTIQHRFQTSIPGDLISTGEYIWSNTDRERIGPDDFGASVRGSRNTGLTAKA